MAAPTALIAGAGIGGLAAGVALRRAGWHVRMFERAASPRELGFALNLAPNAINALRELGLADAVTAHGSAIGQVELRRPHGRVLRRFHVGSALGQARSVVILRPALHGALLQAVGQDAVALSREAVAFEVTGRQVVLLFRDGGTETGDILVGADGVASVVRNILHAEPPARPSGYYGLRGVAHGAANLLGDLSVVGYLGHGIEAAALRAGGDAVYWYMSLLAEDVASGAHEARSVAGRHAVVLDDLFRAVVDATRPEDLRLDELLERKPLGTWGRGPVTLLGDAAHPMLPHTGQGAAQALEDAVALGLAVSAGRDIAASLRKYERIRSRRTRRIVNSGRHIARFTTTKSRGVRWLREAVIRVTPAKRLAAAFLLAERFDPHRALRSGGV